MANLEYVCLYRVQAQNKVTKGESLTRGNRKCLYECSGYNSNCIDLTLARHLVDFQRKYSLISGQSRPDSEIGF